MTSRDCATTPAVALEKQIRLRASDDEKKALETAAKDGGYGTLSDYLRPILLDKHVIIVKPAGEFIVIPAHTADDDQRRIAVRTVEGLVALAQQTSPDAAAEGLLPEAPEADAPAAGEEPTAAPAPDEHLPPQLVGEPPAPALAAVPDRPGPAQILGPNPLPEENLTAFVARRTEELQLEGRTALVASFEAEGEWRRAQGLSTVDPAQPQTPVEQPEATVPAAPAFCPHCGTGNGGTPFCAGCGARLA
jgi:hypothetical protein